MNPKQRQLVLIVAVIIIASFAVLAVIVAANQPQVSDFDYTQLPHSRTEDGAFVLGNPEAPVTIVEYADWACPHCQEYRPTVERFITEQVATGRAKFEFRIFPTAGGQLTVYAGQIAECADEQRDGAFWEAYPLLYSLALSGLYNEDLGRRVADTLNLDYAALLDCSSGARQVYTDVDYGRARQVQGTPAVMVRYGDGDAAFISDTYSRSTVPYDVLVAVVEQANSASS